jgi:hypothetical protein
MMGGRGQGFLVLVLGVIGERNPCPYDFVSIPGSTTVGSLPTRGDSDRVRDRYIRVGVDRIARPAGRLEPQSRLRSGSGFPPRHDRRCSPA